MITLLPSFLFLLPITIMYPSILTLKLMAWYSLLSAYPLRFYGWPLGVELWIKGFISKEDYFSPLSISEFTCSSLLGVRSLTLTLAFLLELSFRSRLSNHIAEVSWWTKFSGHFWEKHSQSEFLVFLWYYWNYSLCLCHCILLLLCYNPKVTSCYGI